MSQVPNDILTQFPGVTLVRQSPQISVLHTHIRNHTTSRENFVFFADRLIRLIVEEGLALLPTEDVDVMTPTGVVYHGKVPLAGVCGVSIMRAGESMEQALRDTCRGARIGKILIQRDEATKDKKPDVRFNYAKMPNDVHDRWVFLMDPMLATGGSAIKAMQTLIDRYNVKPERVIFLNVVSCPEGIKNFCSTFPSVRVVTSAVDESLNEHMYILPGLGDFGDRYFGTD